MTNTNTTPSRDTDPVAPPLRWRRLAAVCGLILASTSPAQSVSPGEFADERLELPPFTVLGKFELPPPELWLYAKIDGFEVLTNASTKESNRLLQDFQLFRQALQIVRPSSAVLPANTTLILCGAEGRFRDFTADGRRTTEGDITRLLVDRDAVALVLDLGTRTIGHSDPPDYLEPERHLYREYVRLLVDRDGAAVPFWLLEGTAQIVMDMEFRGRTIRFGRLNDRAGAPIDIAPASEDITGVSTGATADTMVFMMAGEGAARDPLIGVGLGYYRPFPISLVRRPLLPLDRFFAVTPTDPEAADPFHDHTWAKQAYAFVHLCQFGADRKFKQPFERFVSRLAAEPPTEALFQECFGLTYAQMLEELRRYIAYPRHLFRDIRLAKGSELQAREVVFREATQGEIGRIKGDAQRLAGRQDDALSTYRVAYLRGEREPALLVALGVAEFHAGQADRARRFLEVAIRLGTDRPAAWVTLARLRLDQARTNPAVDGKLSAEQTAAVIAPLLQARSLKPARPETYQVMAEAWALSAVAPMPANIHVLGEGVTLFPVDSDLTLRTAILYLRSGDRQNAAEVARMGLRFAPDEAMRIRFEAFLARLANPPPGS